ncbi:N-acetylmuramoyl-L-alanine amidase, partial [Streptomyces sp. SID7982]|nr:N-acetylmuramoyl-L-alanine amidase [Streptomyces sp. SID7982]
TKEMYASSARLTASICARHGIPIDREHIIGHVEVPGTDHTDPGPHWDWDRYLELVRRAATAPPSPTPSPSAKA